MVEVLYNGTSLECCRGKSYSLEIIGSLYFSRLDTYWESSEMANDIARDSPRKTGSASISFAVTLKETQMSRNICNRSLTDSENSKSQLHHLLFR